MTLNRSFKISFNDYANLLSCKAMDDERDVEIDEEDDEEEYDSGGSGVALTPPDSPG